VKRSSISPPTTAKGKQHLKKLVSNELRDLHDEGLLVKIKRGVYRRPDNTETNQVEVGENGLKPETQRIVTESQTSSWLKLREVNPMRPPETPGDPMIIGWPLYLEQEFRVFPKTLVVVGAVTNSFKTTMAMTLAIKNMNTHKITYINSEMSDEELAGRLNDMGFFHGIPWKTFYDKIFFGYCGCNALNKNDMDLLTGLMDPDGINIIDYIKINDKFYMIGDCLEHIHARLNHGIAVVFFQKDPDSNHLLGKSFPEHLSRVVMMVDIDQKTDLRCLQFTKVKFPAKKGDRPEKRKIWFNVKDGVCLERIKTPIKKKESR
jgi:hypothetical protein